MVSGSSVVVTEAVVTAEPDELDKVRLPRVRSTDVISNLLLALLGILFLIPMLWMILASVNSHATWQIAWPTFTLSHFRFALTAYGRQALINGMVISLIATVVGTVTGILGAYALSRFHIPWKGPLLLAVLFLSAVPITVIIIPVYQTFANGNWLSLVPTSIFLGITTLPFEMYIIKNFIDAVPSDLEEAAKLERADTLTILRRVVIPLALPGIASAAIFAFVNAWGAFLIPLVLITNSAQQPAPVAIYSFITANAVQYGNIAAYSVVYSVPVLILYLGLSRLLSGGFVFGGAVRG